MLVPLELFNKLLPPKSFNLSFGVFKGINVVAMLIGISMISGISMVSDWYCLNHTEQGESCLRKSESM